MYAQHPDNSVAGTYYLHGVMETASVLELNADSSFRFFYSYGAVDRYGSGKWSLMNHQIILNSRKRPPLDFKLLNSKTTGDTSITIQIIEKNRALLSYVSCIVNTSSGNYTADADADGIILFPKESIHSISLIFRLCPDRYSKFTLADKNLNSFQFALEPWIPEIFFDHLKLQYENAALIGEHPLLQGNKFEYTKE